MPRQYTITVDPLPTVPALYRVTVCTSDGQAFATETYDDPAVAEGRAAQLRARAAEIAAYPSAS